MRVLTLATGLALAASLAACHRAAPTTAAHVTSEVHFALVLEHSANGWSAHCETGCHWKDLTMSCGGCRVRLDVSGVGPAESGAERRAEGFAFELRDSGAGWEAIGVSGIHWQRLSWSCGANLCRARIDEAGVQGV